eukprot:scaffold4841_cov121-Skeletonema_dohrnii-CCMP3373.AAC.12
MANYKGSLEAVDCHIDRVRYDMVFKNLLAAIPNWSSSGHLRRCSIADTHIKSFSSGIYISFYAIVTNHNGPLQAVDRDVHSVRYDIGDRFGSFVAIPCLRP